jgi:magnesium transporter
MHRKQNTKYADKIGMPPGALVYIGKKRTEKARITKINFSKDFYEETELDDISAYKAKKRPNTVNWVNINGIHDMEVMESVGNEFKLDMMVMEDIVNTNHRPKADEFEDYLFVTLKTLNFSQKKKEVDVEQISLVLGTDWLLTFQEGDADTFSLIKERIRSSKGHITQRSVDFLFYRLIDTVVDNYFLTMDAVSEAIEELEDKLIADPDENLHHKIYNLKKKIAVIKKAIVPLRDAISTIIKCDYNYISESTKKYFSDVYEHLIHVIESINAQHEMLNDFLNMYLSGLSNKMNEVMQVLTIFASIFIPLTFIAGVYGMNFKYMPELHNPYGYYITWGVMIGLAVALLLYFRKKKWL